MGKYAQLANAADCKSVTLAVNIAGSIPALPTNMVASSKDLQSCNAGSSPAAIILCRIGETGIRTRLRTEVLRVRLPYPVFMMAVV